MGAIESRCAKNEMIFSAMQMAPSVDILTVA
jgi:hypothetical protein